LQIAGLCDVLLEVSELPHIIMCSQCCF